MNVIDQAAARLAEIARALTEVDIKSAPDYPVELAEPCPFVAIYAASGNFHTPNATMVKNFPTIAVEFHLSRTNFKQMQQQANAIIYEFPRRLAGDPTLGGTVATIVFPQEQPIEYSSGPFEWAGTMTHRIIFPVPVKLLPAPLTTP